MYTSDVLPKAITKINKEFEDNDCIIPTIDTYLEYILEEIKILYPKKTDLLEIKKVADTDCRYIQIPKDFLNTNIKYVNFGTSAIERIYVLKFEKEIYIIGADCGGGYTNRFDKNVYFVQISFLYGTTSKKFMEIFKIENELISNGINNYRHRLKDIENINDLHLKIKKLYGVKGVIDENKIDSSELKEQDLLKFLKSLFTLNYGKSARFFKSNKVHNDSNKMFDKNDIYEFCKQYFKHKLLDFKEQEKKGFIPIFEIIENLFKDDIDINFETLKQHYSGSTYKEIVGFKLKGDLYKNIYKRCLFTILDEYYLQDIELINLSNLITYEEINWKNELKIKSVIFFHSNENELISQDIEIKGVSNKYQVLNDFKKVNEQNLEKSSQEALLSIIKMEQTIIDELTIKECNRYINVIKSYFDNLGYFVSVKIDKKEKSSTYKLIVDFIAN